jgi:hypothetical protein
MTPELKRWIQAGEQRNCCMDHSRNGWTVGLYDFARGYDSAQYRVSTVSCAKLEDAEREAVRQAEENDR